MEGLSHKEAVQTFRRAKKTPLRVIIYRNIFLRNSVTSNRNETSKDGKESVDRNNQRSLIKTAPDQAMASEDHNETEDHSETRDNTKTETRGNTGIRNNTENPDNTKTTEKTETKDNPETSDNIKTRGNSETRGQVKNTNYTETTDNTKTRGNAETRDHDKTTDHTENIVQIQATHNNETRDHAEAADPNETRDQYRYECSKRYNDKLFCKTRGWCRTQRRHSEDLIRSKDHNDIKDQRICSEDHRHHQDHMLRGWSDDHIRLSKHSQRKRWMFEQEECNIGCHNWQQQDNRRYQESNAVVVMSPDSDDRHHNDLDQVMNDQDRSANNHKQSTKDNDQMTKAYDQMTNALDHVKNDRNQTTNEQDQITDDRMTNGRDQIMNECVHIVCDRNYITDGLVHVEGDHDQRANDSDQRSGEEKDRTQNDSKNQITHDPDNRNYKSKPDRRLCDPYQSREDQDHSSDGRDQSTGSEDHRSYSVDQSTQEHGSDFLDQSTTHHTSVVPDQNIDEVDCEMSDQSSFISIDRWPSITDSCIHSATNPSTPTPDWLSESDLTDYFDCDSRDPSSENSDPATHFSFHTSRLDSQKLLPAQTAVSETSVDGFSFDLSVLRTELDRFPPQSIVNLSAEDRVALGLSTLKLPDRSPIQVPAFEVPGQQGQSSKISGPHQSFDFSSPFPCLGHPKTRVYVSHELLSFSANDTARDANNDTAKDTTKNTVKDTIKDTVKDANNDTVKDTTKGMVNDTTNDMAKDTTKDAVKDTTKDTGKDTTKNNGGNSFVHSKGTQESSDSLSSPATTNIQSHSSSGPSFHRSYSSSAQSVPPSALSQLTELAGASRYTETEYRLNATSNPRPSTEEDTKVPTESLPDVEGVSEISKSSLCSAMRDGQSRVHRRQRSVEVDAQKESAAGEDTSATETRATVYNRNSLDNMPTRSRQWLPSQQRFPNIPPRTEFEITI